MDEFVPSFFAPSGRDLLDIANSLNLLRAARIVREESQHFPELAFEPSNQAILAAADFQIELVREAYQRREIARLRASYRHPWSR